MEGGTGDNHQLALVHEPNPRTLSLKPHALLYSAVKRKAPRQDILYTNIQKQSGIGPLILPPIPFIIFQELKSILHICDQLFSQNWPRSDRMQQGGDASSQQGDGQLHTAYLQLALPEAPDFAENFMRMQSMQYAYTTTLAVANRRQVASCILGGG